MRALALLISQSPLLIHAQLASPWQSFPSCSQSCLNNLYTPSNSPLNNTGLCSEVSWLYSVAGCVQLQCGYAELVEVAGAIDINCVQLNTQMSITEQAFINAGINANSTTNVADGGGSLQPRTIVAITVAVAGVVTLAIAILIVACVVTRRRKKFRRNTIDLSLESPIRSQGLHFSQTSGTTPSDLNLVSQSSQRPLRQRPFETPSDAHNIRKETVFTSRSPPRIPPSAAIPSPQRNHKQHGSQSSDSSQTRLVVTNPDVFRIITPPPPYFRPLPRRPEDKKVTTPTSQAAPCSPFRASISRFPRRPSPSLPIFSGVTQR